MQQRNARQLDETTIGAHRRSIRGRRRKTLLTRGAHRGEEVAAAARLDPGDPVGRDIALDQRSRPLAPGLEIVWLGQMNQIAVAGSEMLECSHAAFVPSSPQRKLGSGELGLDRADADTSFRWDDGKV